MKITLFTQDFFVHNSRHTYLSCPCAPCLHFLPEAIKMVPARYQNILFTLLAFTLTAVHAIPVSTDGCSAGNTPLSPVCSGNEGKSVSLAVLGDSWASGVAYSNSTAYDNNKDNCLRITEAYGPQLEKNQTWLQPGTTYSFNFAACSGSRLVDISKGREQMSSLQSHTDVIVMTVGGNDAGFYDIASNCIYHQDPETPSFNYGNPYEDDPDRSGLCAKSIDASKEYIEGRFATDVTETIKDMLKQKVVTDNPDLKIYYTGYAEFFNLDDDWCNTKSFAILGNKKALLSHVLRSDMNDLTVKLNNVIKSVTAQFAKQNVRYLSINEGFEGHRFCEKGSNLVNEYLGSNVWFWNLTPAFLSSANVNTITHFDDPAEFLAALTANGTTTIPSSLDLNKALATPLFVDDGKLSASSSQGGIADGWKMRPFHPKLAGHLAIREAIIAQLKADKVPGVQQ